MSTLQKAVGVSIQADSPVASTALSSTMPVSLTNQDSVMCDSGSESMGFSDTSTDVGPNIKDTLFSIKALNGEQDIICLPSEKLVKKPDTNGISETEREAHDIDNDPIVVDEKACVESLVDSMVEKCAGESKDAPRAENLDEDESGSIRITVNTDEDQSPGVEMAESTDGEPNVVPEVKEAILDKSPVIILDESDDNSADGVKQSDEPKGETSEDKLLNDDTPESSDKMPVDEADELRLLMDVDEEEPSKEQDSLAVDDESMAAETTEAVEEDTTCTDGDNVEDNTSLPDRVTSPFSECGSSQSSFKPNKDEHQSDSESSNSSRKHPLHIGNNMKYSFKGIMKTAVTRVSVDSDSAKSSPRRDDSPQRGDSKVCSSKPFSPIPDSSTGSLSVEDTVADSAVDSSTAPDKMNLFEKLGLLTDSENVTESGYNICKQDTKQNTDETVADNCATNSAEAEECMETDCPKEEDLADTNSSVSETSTVTVDNPSACEEISQDIVIKDEKSECVAVTEKVSTETTEIVSLVDKDNVPKSETMCNVTINNKDISDGDTNSRKDPNSAKNVSKTEPLESKAKTNEKESEIASCVDSKKDLKNVIKSEDSKDDKKSAKLKRTKIEGSQSVIEADSDSQDRKRSAKEDPEEDSLPKRSRLDFVIGKLGSQIGISPENLSCDQMSDSDVEGSCKASSDSTENRSEEVTSEDDESSPAGRITEESLELLIKQKIEAVLNQQRVVLTKQFQSQIKELQASNDSWKSQAKELHKRAVELMIHQQRQDRHRAARISGQRRNVGIQVGEERINTLNPQSTSKSSPTSPGRISLLSSPPPGSVNNQMLVQKMAVPTVIQRQSQAPTVKSILNGNRLAQLSAPITQPATAGTQTPIVPTKAKHSPSPTIQTLVKVIDLTSDDESSSKIISTSSPNPTIYRPVTTGLPSGVQPGTRFILSSGGTQLMTPSITTAARPRQPGVQYQYLYAPTNPGIRQGNMVTLVTQRSAPPTTIQPALTVTTPTPPQLTRPILTTVVRPSQNNAVLVRAPPPLYSAPNTVTKSNVTPTPVVTTISEVTPISEKKTPELITVTSKPEPAKHPAPLPPLPANQDMAEKLKQLPPRPGLKISRVSQGIVLSWNMATSNLHSEIASYQLFAYQETSAHAGTTLWKKVGDVKALPLPMACTLTQFQEGNKYHFAVRAVDVHSRVSEFSDPCTIHLVAQSTK